MVRQDAAQAPPSMASSAGLPSAGQQTAEHRAELPRAPALPPSVEQAAIARAAHRCERETLERRSILRGLILLAIFVLLITLFWRGAGRAFPADWWRRW